MYVCVLSLCQESGGRFFGMLLLFAVVGVPNAAEAWGENTRSPQGAGEEIGEQQLQSESQTEKK